MAFVEKVKKANPEWLLSIGQEIYEPPYLMGVYR
jgi:hypothetical protein